MNRFRSVGKRASKAREIPQERLEHSTSRSSVSEMDYRHPASRSTSVGSDASGHLSIRLKRQPSTYGELHELVVQKKLGEDEIRGLVGLENLGNTCFMNSALQCLVNCEALVDYFLGFDWQEEINRDNILGHKGVVAEALGTLANKMWRSDKTYLDPSAFKSQVGKVVPLCEGYQQQDVQEFFAFLLDAVHEDLNRVPNAERKYVEAKEAKEGQSEEFVAMEAWKGYLERNRSIIVDLFQGQLRSEVKCDECSRRSVSFDPFMYLSVPLPERPAAVGFDRDYMGSAGGGRGPPDISLEACIRMFCEEETLKGDNAWYCPSCKKHQPATKKLDLWKVPPVLIVHLKRFTGAAKISSPVTYPLTGLDLSGVVISPQKEPPDYDLFAMANHHGSVHGGHYTAAAKNRMDGSWNLFNDERVSKLRLSEVQDASAYVLFYSKMTTIQEPIEGCGDTQVPGEREELIPMSTISDASENASPVSRGSSSGNVSPKRAAVVVRRQSVSKPHNWPHLHEGFQPTLKPALETITPSPSSTASGKEEPTSLQRTVADQGWGGNRGVHALGGRVGVLPRIFGTPEAEEEKSRAGGSDRANLRGGNVESRKL